MKVSYLHIRNYKQFSNLELDLTYPQGHPKAGEPLDKICIIGQSGTGKTNLLDIIKKSTIDFSEQPENSYLPFTEFVGKGTDDRYITTKFISQNKLIAETLFTNETSKNTFFIEEVATQFISNILEHEKNYFVSTYQNKKVINNIPFDKKFLSRIDERKLSKFEQEKSNLEQEKNNFIPWGSNYKKELLEINNKIDKLKIKYAISSRLNKLKSDNFVDNSIININEINNSWEILKDNINHYDIEKKQYENKLFKEIRKNPKNAEKTVKAMEEWEEKNENILEKIADDINSIISKFNLELEFDEVTQSYEELKIKDLSNNTIIEYDNLSTGTKNLLSTFIPLKSHKPQDSIILIDEPEMSFYPNIQRQLTDLYMGVGENNQLIMATHSPLIASSFEPWEVVELKFDNDNQIYREKYYEGVNHVDNYTLDPRMLTWTSILVDIFDLKEDSFSLREKKLMEYGMLKAEIKAMEKGAERDKKIKIFKKLSALLGLQN